MPVAFDGDDSRATSEKILEMPHNKLERREELGSGEGVKYLPISQIINNPQQPRTDFHSDEIAELSESIKKVGVLQPILVRPSRSAAGMFEIVAGERRWRASKAANITQLPVIIKELGDRDTLEIAIIENVQRENLNAIEEAKAYQRLSDEFGLSQEEIAEKVGKDRASISNILRLLKLSKEVQLLVSENKLSIGHAKAILSIKDHTGQLSLAKKAVAEGLSVRALESIVSRAVVLDVGKTLKEKTEPQAREKSGGYPETIEQLRRALGTKVIIKHHPSGRGKIEIEYFSEAELDRVVDKICAG